MFPDFDVQDIMAHLVEICQRAELFINDYALSNLLVHLLVIIVRLTSNNELGDRDDMDVESMLSELRQRDAILGCAGRIARYFEETFGCEIPDADYQQIILLITLSIERYDYSELDFDKFSHLIDPAFVDSVVRILEETRTRYNIPRVIDEQMQLQLILHMYNAYQRAVYHVSYPNPLAAQIKQEYAPIYDMAVYIVHRFSTLMHVEIGENEVAFIAFHIGVYFERATAPSSTVTGVVIVEEYHDFAQRLVDDLRRALEGDVTIIGVMSCDQYLANLPECDVVITTIDVPVTRSRKILIGPILTKQNLRKIRDRLADVLESKRRGAAWRFLQRILRPELYARNAALDGAAGDGAGATTPADAAIDYLGGLVQAAGLADAAYIADIHLRERVSSTAFTDWPAIPHPINESPAESFIAVLHNDEPIPWERHNVNFALLIGIAHDDMGHFRGAPDIIIELFSTWIARSCSCRRAPSRSSSPPSPVPEWNKGTTSELVENMGRVNYGPKLLAVTQHKGIHTGVMADLHFLTDWEQYRLSLAEAPTLDWGVAIFGALATGADSIGTGVAASFALSLVLMAVLLMGVRRLRD